MFIKTIPSKKFLSCISGKLLGDGCITVQSGRKPRFQFTHTIKDFDWCNFCYVSLKDFIPLNSPYYRKLTDSRMKKGYTESYMVKSKTSDTITKLEEIWYINRKKVIPFDFLSQYLDEQGLAWWYQDDGHLKIVNGNPRKIILSTDNFDHQDNILLIKLLKDKFNLSFSLDGQNRLILYDGMQIHYFYRLIKPYLNASMNRKSIDKNITFQPEITSKRTTIYLPIQIKLFKLTREIHYALLNLQKLYEIVSDDSNYIEFYNLVLKQNLAFESVSSYQITLKEGHLNLIQAIKNLSGLNNSQIVFLCFYLSKKNDLN